MSTTGNFPQCVFGKLIDSSGYAKRGEEHSINGYSKDFPKELMKYCHTHTTGLSNTNYDSWIKYKWLDEGGLISVPVLDEEHEGVIIGRVTGRRESPGGRFYDQAVYIFIPYDQWKLNYIPNLTDYLKIKPLEKKSFDLPPVSIPEYNLDSDLPSDWFQEVSQIMQFVLSGHAFGIQDWSTPLVEIIHLITLCLSIIPQDLACKISFGIGLIDVDGQVQIGHGMRALTKIRKIKSEIKSDDFKVPSSVKDYFNTFHEAVRSCNSINQVIHYTESSFAIIREKYPDTTSLSENAIDAFISDFGELINLRKLENYFKSDSHEFIDLQFNKLKPDAFHLIIDNLRNKGKELLINLCTDEWITEWECYYKTSGDDHFKIISKLLGMYKSLETKGDILQAIRIELPTSLHEKARHSIHEIFKFFRNKKDINYRSLGCDILSDEQFYSKWFSEYFEDNLIFFIMLYHKYKSSRSMKEIECQRIERSNLYKHLASPQYFIAIDISQDVKYLQSLSTDFTDSFFEFIKHLGTNSPDLAFELERRYIELHVPPGKLQDFGIERISKSVMIYIINDTEYVPTSNELNSIKLDDLFEHGSIANINDLKKLLDAASYHDDTGEFLKALAKWCLALYFAANDMNKYNNKQIKDNFKKYCDQSNNLVKDIAKLLDSQYTGYQDIASYLIQNYQFPRDAIIASASTLVLNNMETMREILMSSTEYYTN